MPLITWAYLIIAFSLNSLANILLKIGAGSVANRYFIVILGLAAFAANALFYYLALRSIPVSMAYPVMVVMSFVIINTYAYYRLHEEIAPFQLLGYALILIGLSFVLWWRPTSV